MHLSQPTVSRSSPTSSGHSTSSCSTDRAAARPSPPSGASCSRVPYRPRQRRRRPGARATTSPLPHTAGCRRSDVTSLSSSPPSRSPAADAPWRWSGSPISPSSLASRSEPGLLRRVARDLPCARLRSASAVRPGPARPRGRRRSSRGRSPRGAASSSKPPSALAPRAAGPLPGPRATAGPGIVRRVADRLRRHTVGSNSARRPPPAQPPTEPGRGRRPRRRGYTVRRGRCHEWGAERPRRRAACHP
jgi:hypothetical protein